MPPSQLSHRPGGNGEDSDNSSVDDDDLIPDLKPTYRDAPQETGLEYGLSLDIKRIIKQWEDDKDDWVIKDTEFHDNSENLDNRYAFYIVRWIKPAKKDTPRQVSTTINVVSAYLIEILKKIMTAVPNIGWSVKPVKFEPQDLLVFLTDFEKTLADLERAESTEAMFQRSHFRAFVLFLQAEFSDELRELQDLLKDNRISFPLLWGVAKPGTILFMVDDERSGEPTAMRLRFMEKTDRSGAEVWRLTCEHLEFYGNNVGFADKEIEITTFKGATRIEDLQTYPISRHREYDQMVEFLVQRGLAWQKLAGMQHKAYDGIAYLGIEDPDSRKVVYKNVNLQSRIITHKDSFMLYSEYWPARPVRDLQGLSLSGRMLPPSSMTHKRETQAISLTQDLDPELAMLAPPVVYGFSLADRRWFEFNIRHVGDIQWQKEPFESLDLPGGQKELVQSLIHTHTTSNNRFKDFVEGKGYGLIFNLFGPPGVGKTLTAEATSEVAKMPLYVVSAGDLGTTASKVDTELAQVFSRATVWKAIVLIDEADVFMQKRSMSDLERNAMVAVFLRQIEYFPGILILTTNRVEAFDRAMQSRIDISLHYNRLSVDTRYRLWLAFLGKVGVTADEQLLSAVRRLSVKAFNGRQIKNMVKAASAMAEYDGESLQRRHLDRVVKISEEFQSMGGYGNEGLQKLILSLSLTFNIIFVIAFAIWLFSFRYGATRTEDIGDASRPISHSAWRFSFL